MFIDLGWKGEEHDSYNTQTEAIAALGKFLRDTALPKPSIFVSSGGGLHAYWTLERALTVEEWRPLAHALTEAAKRSGLKFDSQCTIDAARVLRIPQTYNWKQGQPRPVRVNGSPKDFDYSVERIATALEPFKVALPQLKSDIMPDRALFGELPAAFRGQPITNDQAAGIERREDRPPAHLDDIAKECPFVNEAITTGGKSFTNPLWHLTTLIATLTDDPQGDAHRVLARAVLDMLERWTFSEGSCRQGRQ